MNTVNADAKNTRQKILDPIDRISEILFGLIMALTFTGSLSVGSVGNDDVHGMLVGALACNFAWGLVDAVMYLVSNLTERSHSLLTFRKIRETMDPREAERIIADTLPSSFASMLTPTDFESIRKKLRQAPALPTRAGLTKDHWLGALGIFTLVFVSTFPLVIPFLLFDNLLVALRVSNGIAMVMLFLCGHRLGRYAGIRPWRSGLVMLLVGIVLVGITIALGG